MATTYDERCPSAFYVVDKLPSPGAGLETRVRDVRGLESEGVSEAEARERR